MGVHDPLQTSAVNSIATMVEEDNMQAAMKVNHNDTQSASCKTFWTSRGHDVKRMAYIDFVYIWPFLPVHFDADKPPV